MNENIVNYLLGELSEAEQIKLEQQFLADEDTFDLLRAVEHDLIVDYVRGKLTQKQRTQFETLFLNDPARQEQIQAARLLVGYVDQQFAPQAVESEPESSPRSGFLEIFNGWIQWLMTPSGLALATSCLTVVVLGSVLWWVIRRPTSPDPDQVAQIQQLQQQIEKERQNRLEREGESSRLKTELQSEQTSRQKIEQEAETLRQALKKRPVPTPGGFPQVSQPGIQTIVGSRGNQEGTSQEPNEERDWRRIRRTSKPEDFQAFLEKYPQGKYAELARRQLAQLEPVLLSQGYINLGVTQYQVGRYQEALASFQQAVQWAPQSVEAHFNLGMTYLRLGQIEKAGEEYEFLLARQSRLATELNEAIRKKTNAAFPAQHNK